MKTRSRDAPVTRRQDAWRYDKSRSIRGYTWMKFDLAPVSADKRRNSPHQSPQLEQLSWKAPDK